MYHTDMLVFLPEKLCTTQFFECGFNFTKEYARHAPREMVYGM